MIQFPSFPTQLGPDILRFLSPLHSVKLEVFFYTILFNSIHKERCMINNGPVVTYQFTQTTSIAKTSVGQLNELWITAEYLSISIIKLRQALPF